MNKKAQDFKIENQKSPKLTEGFTLPELMVAISIIAIISVVVVFNHQSFSDSVEINNVAQNIGSSIRQAQVSALAVEGSGLAGGEVSFDAGRGVYFDTASPGQIIYFADEDNNRSYDEDGDDEVIGVISIRSGFFVANINCGDGDDDGCQKLHIVYDRPEPEASFSDEDGSIDTGSVSVTVQSPHGRERVVKVYRTGQITVTDPSTGQQTLL